MSDPYNERIKICGLCKKHIAKGTGFWLQPNPYGMKYVHQSCYNAYYQFGKLIVESKKK
jgi:hypothetical protein